MLHPLHWCVSLEVLLFASACPSGVLTFLPGRLREAFPDFLVPFQPDWGGICGNQLLPHWRSNLLYAQLHTCPTHPAC